MSDEIDRPIGASNAEENSGLAAQLKRLERLLQPELRLAKSVADGFVPAWKRVTEFEPRWQVSVSLGVAIALQILLPRRLTLHPHWLLPTLQGVLLLALVSVDPRKRASHEPLLRVGRLVMIAVVTLANAVSAGLLITRLLAGKEGVEAWPLLRNGGAIWLTNVIAFALWYWQFDRGGPFERAHGTREFPDFLFPQMQQPEMAPAHWEPGFFDYLFLSFTNATAFSPTDTLPLTVRAKMTMMLQSGVSLATVALVIARAVNILK